MANNNAVRQLSAYLGSFANPSLVAIPINSQGDPNNPYAGGDIGQSIERGGRTYTMGVLDSGATSATPVGSLAVNQLLVWKDKVSGILTNDARFAVLPGANAVAFVAGVSGVSVAAPGTYGTEIMPIVRGSNIPVAAAPGISSGAFLQLDTTAATARVAILSTGVKIGTALTGTTNGVLFADIDIQVLP